MKRYILSFAVGTAMFSLFSCVEEPKVELNLDSSVIEIGPEGGVRTITITADDSWVASSDESWITISPANGRGTEECRVTIDSALLSTNRTGFVKIQTPSERKEFSVSQSGFTPQIVLDDRNVEIENYADFNSRHFDVTVNTNVKFAVELPEEAKSWLLYEEPEFNFDRKLRPRNVTVRFIWEINTKQEPRVADISFTPIEDVTVERNDRLNVVQSQAPVIPENCVEGDSLALLAINRVLGCMAEYDTSQPMAKWDGVQVYRSGDAKGRVRSAEFLLFNTKEGLPYEVRYLTEAKELSFQYNTNKLLNSISLGEDICSLKKLERLTVRSYGLTELPESFAELTNLTYLDLSSNNFQKIPEVIKSLSKLKSLHIYDNQRYFITDLSKNNKKNIGGLVDDCPLYEDAQERMFPVWLLRWGAQLDTLRLSINFLQGRLPSDKELIENEGFEVLRGTDVAVRDSIAADNTFFDRNDIPKVLPDTRFFTINGNRLYGDIPNWLLFHPRLDQWAPLVLVFPQEGVTVEGQKAGFRNEPTNLNYYYELYTGKVLSNVYN